MIFLNNERFRTSCVIYLFFLRKTIPSIIHENLIITLKGVYEDLEIKRKV